MVITYKNIAKLRFPVYLLKSGNWDYGDGLLFLEGKLLDDKNMPGDTLGIRRAQTPQRGQEDLKKAIVSPNGLLKQSTKYFIDTNGMPFIYEKTVFCKLKYFKITKIDRKDVASIIWVKGCKFPFTVPRPPEVGMTWAGILHLHGLPWMLYEYSDEKLKDSRRKV